VVTSAAEAETQVLSIMGKISSPLRRICLDIFDHPHPKESSPMITDNSTSAGILTKLI